MHFLHNRINDWFQFCQLFVVTFDIWFHLEGILNISCLQFQTLRILIPVIICWRYSFNLELSKCDAWIIAPLFQYIAEEFERYLHIKDSLRHRILFTICLSISYQFFNCFLWKSARIDCCLYCLLALSLGCNYSENTISIYFKRFFKLYLPLRSRSKPSKVHVT